MCRESDNWLTGHFHSHIGHWSHCLIIEHIRQCTFTCTHLLHVNMQWPECLTCTCKCAESHTLISLHTSCTFPSHGSLPIYMNTLDSRISARSHAHIRCMWPECLTCACKCAERQTIGALHLFMHTSVIGPSAQLHEHIRQRIHARLQAHIRCM